MSTRASRRGRTAAVAVVAVVLAVVLSLAGCSSEAGDEAGDDAPRRTTTTTTAPARTSSTAPTTTVTTAAPTTAGSTPGGGGSSAFRGAIDGQDGIEVTFIRGAAALTDVRADDLELTCQPLEGGDAKTITVDVALDQVPLGSGGLVEHTDAAAPYEPTLTGSFTPTGSFAGSLYLSGQRDGFACGGEFTFVATPS